MARRRRCARGADPSRAPTPSSPPRRGGASSSVSSQGVFPPDATSEPRGGVPRVRFPPLVPLLLLDLAAFGSGRAPSRPPWSSPREEIRASSSRPHQGVATRLPPTPEQGCPGRTRGGRPPASLLQQGGLDPPERPIRREQDPGARAQAGGHPGRSKGLGVGADLVSVGLRHGAPAGAARVHSLGTATTGSPGEPTAYGAPVTGPPPGRRSPAA